MDWQQLLVYLIVAAAALYLWRQYAGKRSGCGGCSSGGCGTSHKTAETPREPELIQLELTPRRDPSVRGNRPT